jgi:GNAT superfamily N-acetyltransferase
MDAALPPVRLSWRPTHDPARVYALHLKVIARTPPGMMRPDPLSHFAAHAGANGQTLGCFTPDDILIGYGVLALHSPTVDHLADLLDIEPGRLAILDGAAALPEWRGHGIHRLAITQRMELAQSLGRSAVAATVAPENIRSLRGLLDCGLTIRGHAMLYGGMPRLLLRRDLGRGPGLLLAQQSVPARDIKAHRKALDAGLTGYACRQDESAAWVVDYARP